MWKRCRVAIVFSVAVLLAACGGKGVDKSIATDSEAAYRKTLDEAWADMTVEQQNAYNWAVSTYTLEGLIQAYPKITPRKVIDAESDAYIALHTRKIASITAEMAANAERLAADERRLKEVSEELAKIRLEPVAIKEDKYLKRPKFEYVVHNGSQYDISSLSFHAWLYVDDEDHSDRRCRVAEHYQSRNGLPRGASIQGDWSVSRCSFWDTLEVRNAKKLSFRVQLLPDSVRNYAEKKILPVLSSPTRQDYQQQIKFSEEAIAQALLAKASLAPVVPASAD